MAKDQHQELVQKLVKVKLLKPHTHGGEQHPTDADIEVTVPERDWLAEQGVIAKD